MSSGTLPLGTYHRASQVGTGTYGSVVVVYNEDGAQYALKLFLNDDGDDNNNNNNNNDDSHESRIQVTDLGALREISCLRLLRHENSHPNIVAMVDVQPEFCEEDEGGAGTAGCLGLALPLYAEGSLLSALKKKTISTRKGKVMVAHNLLSAVAHLHDNGWIHRDIKSDNILLERVMGDDDGDDNNDYRAILIDFSLVKLIDDSMYRIHQQRPTNDQQQQQQNSNSDHAQHTGEVGTVTYTAPEVVAREPYGRPSDLWSVGVVLLELFLDEELTATKNRAAHQFIAQKLEALKPDQPFPNLLRGLLAVNAVERLTARQALQHPLFAKFGMGGEPPIILLDPAKALPFDKNDDGSADNNNDDDERPAKKKKNRVLDRREQHIQKALTALKAVNPMTSRAALEYCQQIALLDEELDDIASSQSVLDCVILAHRFFEVEVADLEELDETATGIFANWDLEHYADSEATLFMLMDYCLYPRSFK